MALKPVVKFQVSALLLLGAALLVTHVWADGSPMGFRVSGSEGGRPQRFKQFRPSSSSFQPSSSGSVISPARFFHAGSSARAFEGVRSPSYYIGGGMYPGIDPYQPKGGQPAGGVGDAGRSEEDDDDGKAYIPAIGVRALTNLDKFFEYLRDNVEAIKQEEQENEQSNHQHQQHDPLTTRALHEMQGDMDTLRAPSTGGDHLLPHHDARRAGGGEGGAAGGASATAAALGQEEEERHAGGGAGVGGPLRMHSPIFFPAQSKFHSYYYKKSQPGKK